jgi:hypothetical protein
MQAADYTPTYQTPQPSNMCNDRFDSKETAQVSLGTHHLDSLLNRDASL